MGPTFGSGGLYYAIWQIVWAPFWWLARKFQGPLGLTPPRTSDNWVEQDSSGRLRSSVIHPGIWDWLRPFGWPLAILAYVVPRWAGVRPEEEPSPRGTLAWWQLYIFGSLRRVYATGHGEIIHVGFFLVGGFASATAALAASNDLASFTLYFAFLTYFTAPLIVLAICYAAYAALRRLPPEEYARIALAGRAETDVLRALAFEMLAAVREFRAEIKPLDDHLRTFSWLGDDTPPHEDNLRMLIDSITNQRDNLKEHLKTYRRRDTISRERRRRLIAMKEFATTALGIPKRRLCDHVLNYSPATHQDLANQYARYEAGFDRHRAGARPGRCARDRLGATTQRGRPLPVDLGGDFLSDQRGLARGRGYGRRMGASGCRAAFGGHVIVLRIDRGIPRRRRRAAISAA